MLKLSFDSEIYLWSQACESIVKQSSRAGLHIVKPAVFPLLCSVSMLVIQMHGSFVLFQSDPPVANYKRWQM